MQLEDNSKQYVIVELNIQNAKKAIKFYEKALGAEIIEVLTGEKLPINNPYSLILRNKIIHAKLNFKGTLIFISDKITPRANEKCSEVRCNRSTVSVCLSLDSEWEFERLFYNLAADGEITMPISNQYWGAKLGIVEDNFGVTWTLSYKNP
ncbi:hypothetical protein P344_03575 [Spiroplasma mirum ATCC 29335]|uniref:Glyoxalase/fosfomycin resistance/dioxygenase domain-containing protein n=1 Tax=Spiroplasma mirum ATCC 29335 TaxID=838561 RepID=W0GLH1_9MOLU|nr:MULTISPECIES: glyoxalase/bleomycin resistance/extradiol dioxygenase family protein [Spiroplasma]AHF61027.1 putative glyoxalase [Spiroplasma mirum ATCC 29335]AHI58056.1 hypothetical protein P344_03575 [Spiroplasma mirum ATCC 29335]AKM53133.1 hypothetical protein SATRI_v1c06620 [Spiroplasma atrichopogonis]